MGSCGFLWVLVGSCGFLWGGPQKKLPIRTHQNSPELIKEFKEFSELREAPVCAILNLPKLLKLSKGRAKDCALLKLPKLLISRESNREVSEISEIREFREFSDYLSH